MRPLSDTDIVVYDQKLYSVNTPTKYLNASKLNLVENGTYLKVFDKLISIKARGLALIGSFRNREHFATLLLRLIAVATIEELYLNITNPLNHCVLSDQIEIYPEVSVDLHVDKPAVKLVICGGMAFMCPFLSRIYSIAPVKTLHIS
ncbi:hypothetical protein NEHOM01_2544, partial [Nematocida homosporus]|uniref:uncharacterized protein n=1 Tax=Nematocida homosporus TaxID=1912981 RepID=UPI00221F5B4C